jgi:hypothetical protein
MFPYAYTVLRMVKGIGNTENYVLILVTVVFD